jgi:tryptophan 2,3-dioxygenase
MGNAWEVLKTMTPADYLEFRGALGKASGFQSWQYRTIEFLLGNRHPYLVRPFAETPAHAARLSEILAKPSVYDIALGALVKQGLLDGAVLRTRYDALPVSHPATRAAWLAVYRDTGAHWDLYYMAEKLVDVEDNFRRWRFNHLTTVERLIGHKTGTGGTTGVGYLKKALEVVLFPELWEVRTEL